MALAGAGAGPRLGALDLRLDAPAPREDTDEPRDVWGFFNLVIAYLLVCRVGTFSLRRTPHVLALGLGVLAISLQLSHHFGRFHGGL